MELYSRDCSLLHVVDEFFETLPRTLVSESQQGLLKKGAAFFPPVIRFALECRLDHQEQIDLQFCMRRDEDDLVKIANWFKNILNHGPEQQSLYHFLKNWTDKSSDYYKYIPEVFLELDVLPSGIKTPLLFFELQPSITALQRKQFSFQVLTETLGKKPAYLALLDKIIDACPATAFVAYLGVLFSRDVEVLRVNIKRLTVTELTPFLQEIGYEWMGTELEEMISFVYNYADSVTLCLDIAETVLPKIGFECFWKVQPETETYWQYFVDTLNADQQFSKEKIDTILHWYQDIFPGEIPQWPDHLWIESLGKAENEFSYLKKWMSHLKLTHDPHKGKELKAYLAYESLWATKEPLDKEEIGKLEKIDEIYDIDEAISKGIDFVLLNQQQSGWWKDYYLSPGTSDEWVTAYVAYYLAGLGDPKSNSAIYRAWRILKTRYRSRQGWGYNALTPADADSTIWVWLFIDRCALQEKFSKFKSLDLRRYDHPEGGITTYSLLGPLGLKNKLNREPDFNGWQIPHLCVTAAYALAGKTEALDYLLGHQNTGGSWYGYWWSGPEYATSLAVEALFNTDPEKYINQLNKALKWACIRANEELEEARPNDFKIALLLRVVLCADQKREKVSIMDKMVHHLLRSQETSGYWDSAAEMRKPDSNNTNHEHGDNILVVKDQNKNFTTITVLDAVHKYKQAISFLG